MKEFTSLIFLTLSKKNRFFGYFSLSFSTLNNQFFPQERNQITRHK